MKPFCVNFIALFRGKPENRGKARHRNMKSSTIDRMEGRLRFFRSEQLDDYAALIRRNSRRYRTGFDRSIVRQRQELKKKSSVISVRGKPWQDYLWHFQHIIKDLKT